MSCTVVLSRWDRCFASVPNLLLSEEVGLPIFAHKKKTAEWFKVFPKYIYICSGSLGLILGNGSVEQNEISWQIYQVTGSYAMPQAALPLPILRIPYFGNLFLSRDESGQTKRV